MENESLINVFDTCFIACVALAIVCLILAVVFFFIFRIKDIFLIRTGRMKSRKLDQMKERNAQTGSLRTKRSSLNFTDEFAKSTKLSSPATYNAPVVSDKANETSLLELEMGSTVQLDGKSQQQNVKQDIPSPVFEQTFTSGTQSGMRKFAIVKCCMLIHTDEVI